MDEATNWTVARLRELADKLASGEIVLVDVKNPARMVDITPFKALAREYARTGEYSFTIFYEEAEKPTFEVTHAP